MNCTECRDLLSEYLDEELSGPVAAEVRQHLCACERCQKDLTAMGRMAAAIKALPEHVPNAGTILRISQIAHKSVAPPQEAAFGPVLTLENLAAYLRVDPDSLDAYLDEIPSFEIGGKLLFRKQSVEEWIERRERTSVAQRVDLDRSRKPFVDPIDRGGVVWQTSGEN